MEYIIEYINKRINYHERRKSEIRKLYSSPMCSEYDNYDMNNRLDDHDIAISELKSVLKLTRCRRKRI